MTGRFCCSLWLPGVRGGCDECRVQAGLRKRIARGPITGPENTRRAVRPGRPKVRNEVAIRAIGHSLTVIVSMYQENELPRFQQQIGGGLESLSHRPSVGTLAERNPRKSGETLVT